MSRSRSLSALIGSENKLKSTSYMEADLLSLAQDTDYGSGSTIPVLTVNTYGRISGVTTTPVAGVTDFDYNPITGAIDIDTADGGNYATTITLGPFDTADLAEGTNLYYTDARVGSYLTTNAYSTQAYVDTAISNLVDTAPGTLDTLNELAAAIGDDANFASTMTTSLGTKLNTADFTSTADTWVATKDTSHLAEGSNLYYTDARVRGAISASGSLTYNATTGVFGFVQPDTDSIAEGTSNLFYTDARSRAAISASGSLSYNATTGAITYTQADLAISQVTNLQTELDSKSTYYEQATEPLQAVSGDVWRDTDTSVIASLYVDGATRIWMEI